MKIFVAIPQYKRMEEEKILKIAQEIRLTSFKAYTMDYHPMFSNSIVEMVEQNPQHEFRFERVIGDTTDKGRSILLGIWKKLYDEGNVYDYFIFVDEDLSFAPDAIQMLIDAQKAIVGAAYSYKTDRGPKGNMPVCKFFSDERVRDDGLLKIKWLNGGFVLVSKEAFLKMIEAYPELYWERFRQMEGDDIDIKGSWGLWVPMIIRDFGIQQYLTEDYAFCERARMIGFDIWCHTKVRLTHWAGPNPYNIDWRRVIRHTKTNRPIENKIDGWTNEFELEWLGDKAREMGSIVEIGSWEGRSAKELLENCDGTVYCVDHFQGSDDGQFSSPEIAKREKIFDRFMENVGHFPNLVVIPKSSEEAVEEITGQVDMVWVDGNHTYPFVKKDIEFWLPKCRKLICGHDYNETGVWRAVHDVLGKISGIYENIWYKELSA